MNIFPFTHYEKSVQSYNRKAFSEFHFHCQANSFTSDCTPAPVGKSDNSYISSNLQREFLLFP